MVLGVGWMFVVRKRVDPEFQNLCGRLAGATTT
jgi:hypothetical protein